MYIFITQCFASRIGGIENLMTNLALSFATKHEVKVFADQHLYVQDKIFDLENNKLLKIYRYGGLKFFRRRKKSKDIKLFIENQKIDGIIADTWKSLELCIKEINIKKIPVMCLAHGNELLYDNEKRKNRIIKTLNQIRYIVSNSKYTNQLVKDLGISNNNTFVINPGAKDLRNLKGENIFNFSGDPIILTLARLEKRKGHAKVLNAIKQLKNDFPKINYIIAGEGSEKKYLLDLTNQLKLNNHVKFINNINEFEKKEIFSSTTIMVMPTTDETSNRSIEGFGIVFIEAAMFGICSIATNIGGISDAIVDNETGILLKPNDNLYECIKNLLMDKEKIATLGKNAQKRAIEKFNWDNVVNNYINLFNN